VRAGTRRAALALTLAGAVGAAGLTGVALAASRTPPPAVRALSATGFALAYDVKTLTAPAGPVRLVLTNRSDLGHNVAVRGPKLPRPRLGKVVGRGKRSVISFANLPAGRYTFYCSVFGHEAGGMKGALTVTKRRG
jgi:plastocyanin